LNKYSAFGIIDNITIFVVSVFMITSFFSPKKKEGSPEEQRSQMHNDTLKRSADHELTSSSKRMKLSEVEQLISFLHDSQDDENNTMSNSWRQALARHTSSHSFEKLAKYLSQERNKATIYPPPAETFTALTWTPLSDVKVVIVGQDPYHGPNQAHGLCFSVRKGIDIPPSLKNIYKELANDPEVPFPNKRGMPRHGYLERWARQGVLMLNSVLTVRQGEANSHRKQGWEEFTDHVLRVVSNYSSSQKKGLVVLLWGKPANEKATQIIRAGPHVRLISTSHPSPLGASQTKTPFLGSHCFSRANVALRELQLDPIDWNVDDE
jgi:uracil-DNA glycosylase